MATTLLYVLAGVLTVAMLVAAAASLGDERRARSRDRRIARSSAASRAIAVLPGRGMGNLSLALDTKAAASNQRLAKLLPGGRKMRDLLDRTGRSISLTHFAAAMGVVGLGVFFVTILLHVGLGASVVIAGIAAVFIPRFVVLRMAKRRLAAFIQQFPDAIDLIVRALRAGLPLSEALVTISQECADPVGAEFRKVVGALMISRSIEDSLWEIERTIDCAELRFFIISIATQIQTGGNLGETLGNLATILRQRSQMRIKVKAMTGEARASAAVLGSLPFIIGLLMSLTNPTYIAPLFVDPRGWVMLGGGAVMLMIGVGVMAQLVSFEI